MKKQFVIGAGLVATVAAALVGCATGPSSPPAAKAPTDAEIVAIMKASFKDSPSARLTRLDQSPLQQACTEASRTGKPLDDKLREQLQAAAMASVKYPVDGKYLGDWKRGEAIAQNGRGLQYSDAPGATAGGNCYACHQIDKAEIAHGNIGPTLLAASWTLARARWALQKNDAAQITATSALLKTLVDDWRAVNADSEWHGEALWWLSQTERALGETTAATQHRDAARAMLAKSRLPGLQRLAAK